MEFLDSSKVLVALAILVLVAIALDFMRRVRRNRYEDLQMSSSRLERASKRDDCLDDMFGSDFPAGGSRIAGYRDVDFNDMEDVLLTHQDIGERYSSVGQSTQLDIDWEDSANPSSADRTEKLGKSERKPRPKEDPQIIIIHLMSEKGKFVGGSELLAAVLEAGLRYGAMGIFHYHRGSGGSGPVVFSLANILNPGTFDLNDMPKMTTPGATMFMNMDEVDDPGQGFDAMIAAAKSIAMTLQMHVLDESRSSMTLQTIDHYRQRAREYVRRKSKE